MTQNTGTPFTIARTFEAPRERVWRAWTERDQLMQWFGPTGFKMPVATLDFAAGGTFHYRMESPTIQMWGKWRFLEITPPERIQFVSSFSDETGAVTRNPWSPTWPLEMISTITFTEENGKTTVALESSGLKATAEEEKTFANSHDSMKMGWTGTFDQLAAFLAQS